MSNFPLYQGKPTAYLDHNILDFLLKNPSDKLIERLFGEYQILYSDETLKEIQRSVGWENMFLDLLNELEAFHLKIIVDSQFKLTDQAIIRKDDCHKIYKEYKANKEMVFERLQKSMLLDMQKIYGGIKDLTSEDIINEQIIGYNKLHDLVLNNIDVIKVQFPELAMLMLEQNADTKKKFINASEEKSRLMIEQMESFTEQSLVKYYRDHFGVGPISLNNIKSPNILQKIWKLSQKKIPEAERCSVSEFFLLDKNPINSLDNYFDYQKVNVVYSMLNMLGYYPDSDMDEDKRFIASWSDQSHAGIATFADALFSNDANFLKKVGAAYEFLNIRTQIHQVKINKRRT